MGGAQTLTLISLSATTAQTVFILMKNGYLINKPILDTDTLEGNVQTIAKILRNPVDVPRNGGCPVPSTQATSQMMFFLRFTIHIQMTEKSRTHRD